MLHFCDILTRQNESGGEHISGCQVVFLEWWGGTAQNIAGGPRMLYLCPDSRTAYPEPVDWVRSAGIGRLWIAGSGGASVLRAAGSATAQGSLVVASGILNGPSASQSCLLCE